MQEELIEQKIRSLLSIVFENDNFEVLISHSPSYGFKATIATDNPETLRHLIGRGGRTINNFRDIFHLIEARNDFRCEIQVLPLPHKIQTS